MRAWESKKKEVAIKESGDSGIVGSCDARGGGVAGSGGGGDVAAVALAAKCRVAGRLHGAQERIWVRLRVSVFVRMADDGAWMLRRHDLLLLSLLFLW